MLGNIAPSSAVRVRRSVTGWPASAFSPMKRTCTEGQTEGGKSTYKGKYGREGIR